MSNYKIRSSGEAKTVLVNPTTYKSTLEITHKFKRDTALNVDQVRIGVASAYTDNIKTCKDACGLVRREVVNLEMSVLLGMEDEYYTRRKQQLADTLAAGQKLLEAFDEVKLGLVPSIEIDATVS